MLLVSLQIPTRISMATEGMTASDVSVETSGGEEATSSADVGLNAKIAEMDNLLKTYMEELEHMKEKVKEYEAAKKVDVRESEEKLKPIDIQDVKKPDEYDGDTKTFTVWLERFKDILDQQARVLGGGDQEDRGEEE